MKTHILTNFNVPIFTKNRFDRVCQISGRTRTSVLIELMERYVVDQVNVIETKNLQLDRIDGIITDNRLKNRLKDRLDITFKEVGNGLHDRLKLENQSDRLGV